MATLAISNTPIELPGLLHEFLALLFGLGLPALQASFAIHFSLKFFPIAICAGGAQICAIDQESGPDHNSGKSTLKYGTMDF
ncbi:MAG: hypothetical protein NXI24_22690 [bacterium]|nr:hypothetical protein [bacterium]